MKGKGKALKGKVAWRVGWQVVPQEHTEGFRAYIVLQAVVQFK